jgi:hypothetical protein
MPPGWRRIPRLSLPNKGGTLKPVMRQRLDKQKTGDWLADAHINDEAFRKVV